MSWYMFGGEIARTIGPLMVLGAISLWGMEGTWKLIPFALVSSVLLYFKLRKVSITDEIRQQSDLVGLKETFKKSTSFFIVLVGMTFFQRAGGEPSHRAGN